MKKQRIEVWKNKKRPKQYYKKTLKQLVQEMILFFDKFEYAENALMMSYHDYRSHVAEFTGSENNIKLAGIPVYFSGIMPCGQIALTTIENAEQLTNSSGNIAI